MRGRQCAGRQAGKVVGREKAMQAYVCVQWRGKGEDIGKGGRQQRRRMRHNAQGQVSRNKCRMNAF